MGQIYIGISGWRYVPWRGVFYPEKLPQAGELEFASRALPSIELNGSFYALQRPESYAAWYEVTPPNFMFSVKGNRYITHILRLQDIEKPLANVFASGVFNLQEKLGPFLWQFPPNFRFEAERLERFLRLLPQDTEQALKLARRRDAIMKGRSRLAIDQNRPMRHAMEIRHDSFIDRLLSVCYENIASRWWSRIRPGNGRIAKTSHPIFSICVCTATRRCMRAVIPKRRWIAGRRGYARGAQEANPTPRNASGAHRLR